MKKSLFLTLVSILLATLNGSAQIAASDYVTTWKSDNPGTSEINQVTIPASGEFTIYYENVISGISGNLPELGTFTDEQTITLPVPGTYRLAIKPVGSSPFHRITMANTGDSKKLMTIEQWGNTAWSSFEGAYTGCENLSAVSATDIPLLFKATSMQSAFQGCSQLISIPRINDWDVSGVTNMKSMFYGASVFNQPVGNWDVSSVNDMSYMFIGAATFNQPIGNWDVSSVIDMRAMFSGAQAFNQPIMDWDVSSVTGMGSMFLAARAFNQPIGSWDVSSVNDMGYMFAFATGFNQPLGNWNVSAVTVMINMFGSAWSFNQSLGDWSLKSILYMNDMLGASGIDCRNFGATLVGWAANPATASDISFGATGKIYGLEAVAARNFLINTKRWRISGDLLDTGCSALPVTLISFSAEVTPKNFVQIKWETVQENNNERFVIERSKDLTIFETVAEIRDVAGSSNRLKTYDVIDQIPLKGTSYYRLLQYDTDGSKMISKIIQVVVRSESYSIYPNPTPTGPFKISLDEPLTAQIGIYDIGGRPISFERAPYDKQTVAIQTSELVSAGTYQIVVQERGTRRTFRLVVR